MPSQAAIKRRSGGTRLKMKKLTVRIGDEARSLSKSCLMACGSDVIALGI